MIRRQRQQLQGKAADAQGWGWDYGWVVVVVMAGIAARSFWCGSGGRRGGPGGGSGSADGGPLRAGDHGVQRNGNGWVGHSCAV